MEWANAGKNMQSSSPNQLNGLPPIIQATPLASSALVRHRMIVFGDNAINLLPLFQQAASAPSNFESSTGEGRQAQENQAFAPPGLGPPFQSTPNPGSIPVDEVHRCIESQYAVLAPVDKNNNAPILIL